MKKVFLLSLVCSCLLAAKAQVADLNDFYQPGARWGGLWINNAGGLTMGPVPYGVSSDTVVNGYTYHLIDYLSLPKSKLGVRVDGQKVYFQSIGPDTIHTDFTRFLPGVDHLLYDYDIKVGDTLFWKPYNKVVRKIDSVNYKGSFLRRYYFFTDIGYWFNDYWVEGMGSYLSFFGSYATPAVPGGQSERTAVYCTGGQQCRFEGGPSNDFFDGNCSLKGLGVNSLQPKGAIELYPNPSRGDVHLKSEGANLSDVAIYDLQGGKVYDKKFPTGTDRALLQAALSPGAYMVRITLDNGMVTTRRLVRY